jgi:hypothetical protein
MAEIQRGKVVTPATSGKRRGPKRGG